MARTSGTAEVRMLAFLHTHQRKHERPTKVAFELPEGGMSAEQIALALDLPMEIIEGLFLNGTLVGLGALVQPGDRVAFLPYGTPASHPAFFNRTGIESSLPV